MSIVVPEGTREAWPGWTSDGGASSASNALSIRTELQTEAFSRLITENVESLGWYENNPTFQEAITKESKAQQNINVKHQLNAQLELGDVTLKVCPKLQLRGSHIGYKAGTASCRSIFSQDGRDFYTLDSWGSSFDRN